MNSLVYTLDGTSHMFLHNPGHSQTRITKSLRPHCGTRELTSTGVKLLGAAPMGTGLGDAGGCRVGRGHMGWRACTGRAGTGGRTGAWLSCHQMALLPPGEPLAPPESREGSRPNCFRQVLESGLQLGLGTERKSLGGEMHPSVCGDLSRSRSDVYIYTCTPVPMCFLSRPPWGSNSQPSQMGDRLRPGTVDAGTAAPCGCDQQRRRRGTHLLEVRGQGFREGALRASGGKVWPW